jgi:hypothetical protein
MDWKEQIAAAVRWLNDHPEVTWSGIGTTLLVAVCSWLLARCFRKKNSAAPHDASALLAGSVLTIDKYKEHLMCNSFKLPVQQPAHPDQAEEGLKLS